MPLTSSFNQIPSHGKAILYAELVTKTHAQVWIDPGSHNVNPLRRMRNYHMKAWTLSLATLGRTMTLISLTQ